MEFENVDLKRKLSDLATSESGASSAQVSPDFNAKSKDGVRARVLSGQREHRKTTGSSSGVSSDQSDSDENEHKDEEEVNLPVVVADESGVFDASSSALRSSSISTQTPEPETDADCTQFTVLDIGGGGKSKSPATVSHRHASDYESCEELDDLREECRDLVTRKNSLETEIEEYKGEIR